MSSHFCELGFLVCLLMAHAFSIEVHDALVKCNHLNNGVR